MEIKPALEENRKRILTNAVKYAYKEEFFNSWNLKKDIVGKYIYQNTLVYILRYYRSSGSFPIEDKIFINQMITNTKLIPIFDIPYVKKPKRVVIEEITKPKKMSPEEIIKGKSLTIFIKEAEERLKEVKVYIELVISRLQNRS